MIEPMTRAFLDKINASKGPQIYEMTPEDARDVLSKLQKTRVTSPPADVEDRSVPGGPKGEIPIRIVRPKGSAGPLPIVMYFHGGGWVLGDRNTHDHLVRELASKANAAIVFVDYTRSPEAKYPVAIEESYQALEYITKNSGPLNLNAFRIAVAGDSVGGNMATAVSLLSKQRRGPQILFQALFYPVTDASFDTSSYKEFATGHWLGAKAMKWFWDQYLPDKEARKQPTASPLQASADQLKGMPPALIITDENDVLRDEGEAYAHKLMAAGVQVTAVRYLGTVHDFMMLNPLAGSPAARGAIELAAVMLKNVLKEPALIAR
jgi:acetyl esterase/lipase